MKRLLILFIVALACCQVNAKTASFVAGNRDFILDVSAAEFNNVVDFGFRYYGQYSDPSQTDRDLAIQESFVGPVVKVCLIETELFDRPLKILGTAAALWHVESKDDIITPVGASFAWQARQRLGLQVDVQYCKESVLFKKHDIRVFGGIYWKFD